jgi:hypothetical protein
VSTPVQRARWQETNICSADGVLTLIRNSRSSASADQRVPARGCALVVPALHPSPSGTLTRRAAEDATPRHPLLRRPQRVPEISDHRLTASVADSSWGGHAGSSFCGRVAGFAPLHLSRRSSAFPHTLGSVLSAVVQPQRYARERP